MLRKTTACYYVQRWVRAFRLERLNININTNNGLESQNRVFKHSYLFKQRQKSLTATVAVLVKQYLPDSYRR